MCSDPVIRRAYRVWNSKKQQQPDWNIESREFISWWKKQNTKGKVFVCKKDKSLPWTIKNLVIKRREQHFICHDKVGIQAYNSWRNQKQRCEDRSHKQYRYYGAKGIKVIYSVNEFVVWWRNNLKSFKGKIPTVGRIDHAGHYSFDNIEMQDKSKNSIERIFRHNGILHPVKNIIAISPKGIEQEFISQCEAERVLGIPHTSINRSCNKKTTLTNGWSFRFKDEYGPIST